MSKNYNQNFGWETPFDKEIPEQTVNKQPVEGIQEYPQSTNDDSCGASTNESFSLTETEFIPVEQPTAYKEKITTLPDIEGYIASAQQALESVDDIVSKGYLEHLHKMSVIGPDELNEDDLRLYKVDLMAYEKDEYATDKFVSAFTAMTFTNNTVFLIVDGHENCTDFYIGVKNESDNHTSSISNTFENSLRGQFPGIKLTDLSLTPPGEPYSPQHRVIRDLKNASSISSYAGVPSLKGDGQYTNMTYIQGIEKLVDAMQGKRYTAIVIARNQMPSSITSMRNAYEGIYSQLSCMATQQLAYSTNESLAHALTRSQGTSDTTSHSISDGTSINKSTNHTHSTGKAESISNSKSESQPNLWSKGSQFAGPLCMLALFLSHLE